MTYKPYTIHKPHYELRNRFGAVHGTIQVRNGDYVCVNMADGRKETSGSPSLIYHLTNYGRGTDSAASKEALAQALDYLFGSDRVDPELVAVKL